ncbi:group 10 secretory phospholipase A2 [Rousettus aegyptiacus]|uniref:group 10 secretory phospholipase A2 n=1 Tax=Rousettus aegyptiacus TaxID=9407 RepID=UPI00168D6D44|nr:group 10 secretory phospholipase A2 [Rousettus aegyptiacus]
MQRSGRDFSCRPRGLPFLGSAQALREVMLPLLLLLLVPGLLSSAVSLKSHVHRRGLIELAEAIDCVGPRSPLAYVSYGCYCGLGGHGQPLDAIDWCCHHHDCCYQHANEEAGCRTKVEPYFWKCVNQHIICGPAEDRCQELLCKCDQEIAYCLAQTKYSLRYLFYPRFLCGQDSLKCD